MVTMAKSLVRNGSNNTVRGAVSNETIRLFLQELSFVPCFVPLIN